MTRAARRSSLLVALGLLGRGQLAPELHQSLGMAQSRPGVPALILQGSTLQVSLEQCPD